jgi:hypothetical protein
MSQKQQNRVASITNAGATAYSIAVQPRHSDTGDENNPILLRNVVNARQKFRLDMLAGRRPMQAMLVQLREGGFALDYDTDMNGHLTRLFFAFTHSLSTFARHPEVLLLDCTYRTNRFKLPLLNMGKYKRVGQILLRCICIPTVGK